MRPVALAISPGLSKRGSAWRVDAAHVHLDGGRPCRTSLCGVHFLIANERLRGIEACMDIGEQGFRRRHGALH